MHRSAFLALRARLRGFTRRGTQGVELSQGLLAQSSVTPGDIAVLLFAVVLFGLTTLSTRNGSSIHDVARFESVAVETAAARATAEAARGSGAHTERTASQTAHDQGEQCTAHGLTAPQLVTVTT